MSESTFCFIYWCLCLNNYLEIVLHWIALQISVSLVPLALSCSVHVANLAKDENFHINTCSLCVTFNCFRKFVCIFPSIFAWTFLHGYFSGFSCVNCVQYGRFKWKKKMCNAAVFLACTVTATRCNSTEYYIAYKGEKYWHNCTKASLNLCLNSSGISHDSLVHKF